MVLAGSVEEGEEIPVGGCIGPSLRATPSIYSTGGLAASPGAWRRLAGLGQTLWSKPEPAERRS